MDLVRDVLSIFRRRIVGSYARSKVAEICVGVGFYNAHLTVVVEKRQVDGEWVLINARDVKMTTAWLKTK